MEMIAILPGNGVNDKMMSSGMAAKKAEGFALLAVECVGSPPESSIMRAGAMNWAV